jgi:hypothetical protein
MNEESNNTKNQVEDASSLTSAAKTPPRSWQCVERLILMFTFILTAIGTVYSVQTARQALIQSSIDLRPWIAVSKVNTYLKPDRLETRFEITNIGKTPAYVIVECDAYRNGDSVKQQNPEQGTNGDSILPGQKFLYEGFGMKGDTYQNLLNGLFKEDIVQSIKVKYSRNKSDDEEFWTYIKVRFDIKDLPHQPQDDPVVGLWNIVESDFK